MQADLLQDLQTSGLLASWQSWGQDVGQLLGSDVYNNNENVIHGIPGLEHLEPSGQHSAMHQHQEQHISQAPALAPAGPEASGLDMRMDVDEATATANIAAEESIAVAAHMLLRSQRVLQDVTTANHRPMPGGSSSHQSASATRKSNRMASDGHTGTANGGGGRGSSSAAGSNKGLRQFALMVCEQVRARGRTTYNEVADVLVSKLGETPDGCAPSKDVDKTIRRRVYDAINVLMATDIIQREKKDITWKGLPGLPGDAAVPLGPAGTASGQAGGRSTGSVGPIMIKQEEVSPGAADAMRQERLRRISDVDRKQTYLQELLDQHVALKQLVQRNASQPERAGTAIHLPFILIQARPGATVEVDIAEDMRTAQFDFHNSPIQIHDDSGVIKQMAQHQMQINGQQPSLQRNGTAGTKAGTPRSGFLPTTNMAL